MHVTEIKALMFIHDMMLDVPKGGHIWIQYSRHNLHPLLASYIVYELIQVQNELHIEAQDNPVYLKKSLLFTRMNKGGGTHTTPPQLAATISFGTCNARVVIYKPCHIPPKHGRVQLRRVTT